MIDRLYDTLYNGMLVVKGDGSRSTLAPMLAKERWQREDYEALAPALLGTMGVPFDGKRRHWIERPRGHSKTTDLATLVTWLLALTSIANPPRALRIVAAAADVEQAGLLRDAIERIVEANDWLNWKRKDKDGKRGFLDVQATCVRNPTSKAQLDIISSDVASSWGLLPDVVICDELTAWPEKGEKLWHSLFSSGAKKANAVIICIGNAGWRETWQWGLREKIRSDPAWRFSRLEGPVASWIDAEALAEQQRLLPAIVYARCWLNQWASGSGDAISEDSIQAALVHDGPVECWEPGFDYVAGLDIGLTRDASALVVVGRNVGWTERKPRPPKRRHSIAQAMVELGMLEANEPEEDVILHPSTGKTRLASVQVWRPSPGVPVSIEAVEDAIVIAHRRYNLSAVAYDPWQAAYLAERLTKRGIGAIGINQVPGTLKSMASCMMEALAESHLELYPDPDLLRDLRALRIVERNYGIRLESPRGPSGHGDSASALALALLVSKRFDLAAPRQIHGELVCWPE